LPQTPAHLGRQCFGELVDVYPDLKSDRVNLLKARELDPDHPLSFEHVCELTEAIAAPAVLAAQGVGANLSQRILRHGPGAGD
jgi:hypothetical protein